MARSRPTILQIIPRLDAGGAELSAIEVTEAIVRAGGRAIVLTEGGRMADRIGAVGGELVAFPAGTKNPIRLAWNARTIASLARHEAVDVIHARSRAPAWSALAAARMTRLPFVTTYHGAYSEANAAKRLYNSVMARADVVIANSAYTRRLVLERYRADPSRVRVIHRGIDATVFDPDAVAPERLTALRRAWGVAEGERVLLVAARLTAWKGQAVLIAALERLARAGLARSVVAVLAGDAQGRDGYVEGLRRQIAAAGLQSAVRIVGHVSDMPAAFRAAHIAVVPSTEPEAFGRSVIEAQAMGTPVIATDIGAPPETVIAAPPAPPDAITGWLVPPNDTVALAGRLAEALALEPAAHAALGRRARANVIANFTLEAMKRATLKVYDGLLGTRLEDGLASTRAVAAIGDRRAPSGPADR